MLRVRDGLLMIFVSVLVAGLPVRAQEPAGWNDVVKKALAVLADKPAEAIALIQKVVDANPNFGEGHSMLAGAHSAVAETLENGGAASAATRKRHLEAAARHYRRSIELTHLNRVLNQLSLAETYGPGGLNLPREAEAAARSVVETSAASRVGQALLAWALLETGRQDAAQATLRQARSVIEPDDRLMLGAALSDLAKQPSTSVAAARVLLAEAVSIADEAIKTKPAFGQAYMFKSVVLEVQADKVEQDAARKSALKKDASGLWEKGREVNGATLRQGASGDLPLPPPPPPPPLDAFAETRYRKGVELWDKVYRDGALPPAEGRKLVAEAVAALDEALKVKPDYLEAIVYKSVVLRLQAEKFETDPARRKALIAEADRLRARAVELQKRQEA